MPELPRTRDCIAMLKGDAYPVTLVVDGARQYPARKGKVCECASLPV